MGQRLHQRLVGVLQSRILADHGDRHLALGIVDPIGNFLPPLHAGLGRRIDAESRQQFAVQPFLVIGHRHIVDVRDVERLDHGRFAHVAEQRELASLFLRDRPVRADQQDVGGDADRTQFLDRVLRRLGLQLAGRRYPWHQREVDVDRVVARQVVAELADRLQEGHGFDVADRSADLAQHEIVIVIAFDDEVLDLVGDVRNHLDGGAEVVAAALLLDDVLVDAAGGDVVLLVGGPARESLVMAEIEIGLGPVVGHEDLAVLVGRHRARIDVEIGIELLDARAVAARLQQGSQSRRRDAFAKRGNHAASNEYISRHGSQGLTPALRFRQRKNPGCQPFHRLLADVRRQGRLPMI